LLYTDIRELKSVLEIDPANTAEDKNLLFYIQWATNFIEEFLGRKFSLQTRTEFYHGSGTQQLVLKNRPIYSSTVPQVYVDGGAYFGTATGAFTAPNSQLVYGTDFCLQLDLDTDGDGIDDASRCGILVRINRLWEKPYARQWGLLTPFLVDNFGSIKVIYSAGYTVDTLPPVFRNVCNMLVSRLRYIYPLGLALTGESYEERNISIDKGEKTYMLNMIQPLLYGFRNWKW